MQTLVLCFQSKSRPPGERECFEAQHRWASDQATGSPHSQRGLKSHLKDRPAENHCGLRAWELLWREDTPCWNNSLDCRPLLFRKVTVLRARRLYIQMWSLSPDTLTALDSSFPPLLPPDLTKSCLWQWSRRNELFPPALPFWRTFCMPALCALYHLVLARSVS